MVVHLLQEELQKKLSSTQMLEEVEVEEADLEAVVEIKMCSKLKKTSPMEEDVITLEAGGAKEVMVDGKEAKMQTVILNATTVVKWIIWLKTAIKS